MLMLNENSQNKIFIDKDIELFLFLKYLLNQLLDLYSTPVVSLTASFGNSIQHETFNIYSILVKSLRYKFQN